MIISITFKTPDAVDDVVDDEVFNLVSDMNIQDEDEAREIEEAKRVELKEFLGQWITHGELITIEFDTEKSTAIVRKKE
jgi:hypothetical protein